MSKSTVDFKSRLIQAREEMQRRNSRQDLASEETVGECQQHQAEMVVVCLTCKRRVCPKCALFGGHKDHDVKEEKEA